MQVTDGERRTVAERLREDAKRYLLEGRFCSNEMPHRLAKAVGCRYMGAGPQISELFPRLADLIDPDTINEQTNHDESSLSASPIDRDALLALADKLERDADEAMDYYVRNSESAAAGESVAYRDCARRVREACGVES